jgi:hypothetical protein
MERYSLGYLNNCVDKEMTPTLAQWLLDRSGKGSPPAVEAARSRKAATKAKRTGSQEKRKQKN